jgi:hypothetical protein
MADQMGRAASSHIESNHTLAAGAKRLSALAQKAITNHQHRTEAQEA